MLIINGKLKALRLLVSADEVQQCKSLAEEAIRNADSKGAKSRWNTNELRNKFVGYVGELKFSQAMKSFNVPGEWLCDASGLDDKGVDWRSYLGVRVDVKTIRSKVLPQELFNFIIDRDSAEKHRGLTDVYVLCTYQWSKRALCIVGGVAAEDFLMKCRVVKPGDDLGACKAKNNAYLIKYKKLAWNFPELCSTLRKLKI